MSSLVPKKVFFVKGTGRHRQKLQSFELALRDAGIEKFNLVRVSSILPANCVEVSAEEGLAKFRAGQIVFCVMAKHSSNEKNRLISASIGVAKPAEDEHYGYLSENHDFGMDEGEAGEYAEDLAASMLASTLGVSFNPDAAYDEKKEAFCISGKIVETKNVTQTAVVLEKGQWTTVIAAAMFVME
ncbi:MAG: pyruvoyl-dependent arginine decarboxylase [Promethearchaeota archaeon]